MYFRATSEGIVAFDAVLQQDIMFFANIFQLLGDNPMLAELASHIGLNGNFFCYWCKTGGTKEHKMSSICYNKLFRVSVVNVSYLNLSQRIQAGAAARCIDDTHRGREATERRISRQKHRGQSTHIRREGCLCSVLAWSGLFTHPQNRNSGGLSFGKQWDVDKQSRMQSQSSPANVWLRFPQRWSNRTSSYSSIGYHKVLLDPHVHVQEVKCFSSPLAVCQHEGTQYPDTASSLSCSVLRSPHRTTV